MSHKSFKIFAFIFAITIAGSTIAYAQKKEDAVKNKILDKNYDFLVQSVTPTTGSTRQLSPDYDLRVTPDSIISYLPYFGRAYSAPVGSSDGGINFTSTKFDYTLVNRNKGGWDITIKPRDTPDVQELFLTVFSNGSAILQVTSTNRQPISFNGYISERNKR